MNDDYIKLAYLKLRQDSNKSCHYCSKFIPELKPSNWIGILRGRSVVIVSICDECSDKDKMEKLL
jgi:hypothetical protein